MKNFQVRVVFENGATMLFGVLASDLDEARAVAGERIPPYGTVKEIEVGLLTPVSDR